MEGGMQAWKAVNLLLDEMREAKRQVENNGNTMIELLIPNLRNLSPYRLARLKRALQNFNSVKKEWKE